MIKTDRDCATALLSLAKQTKNYSCLDNKAFLEDVDTVTSDISNKNFTDVKYLIDRIETCLTENYDRRGMAGYKKLEELKDYLEI